MHRRDALKLLALIFLGGGSSACGTGEGIGAGMASKGRTIVIGAGLAGLAAARELRHNGHDVVVVEARDRIGGRLWTSSAWPDMPLDLGATWIHGVRDNPMTDLADTLQARRLVTSYDKLATYDANGQLFTDAEAAHREAIGNQVRMALHNAQQRDADVTVRQAVAALTQRLQPSLAATRLLNFVVSSEIEHEYAASAHRLSAHWYDSADDFEGDDALFVRGFQVITDYLATDLPIEFSQVVKEIFWGEHEVRVFTEKMTFAADRVVVTLPLGVLQSNSVRFTPELPSAKRQALAALGMGVLNKCYLRFNQAFWPHDIDWLGHVSAQHGVWNEWVSFQRVAQMPILLGFNAADHGLEIEAWSDQQIVASAIETLRIIFGAGTPQPSAYQITRWATDPFARGAYSYNALGSTPSMRDTLAMPVDAKLFFAGEASHSAYFGTTHGAYLSGLRVAEQILEL
ncbi:flavin monoamine oxidase family protein [Candidatus Viridilinea mediisalina]|uniref:Amine oxidase n=1 Tax=Candidatus Viridilinea mediisalina TaxID=2024553 RepID=A0A2A6RP40_9CHLR|nr:FAD-dependent oxidoreductase [Candidatus Viridilinea mediisalina]PDW04661.1 amine oxidase [Candidatus Viridilinea mediisalina]